MARKNRNFRFLKYIVLLIFAIIICIFFYNTSIDYILDNDIKNIASSSFIPNNSEKLLFYFINTGNSESLLIIDPSGYTMLIDTADDENFDKIKTVLDKYNITRINNLVATHTHSDHIGAMDDIIRSFNIDVIYITNCFDDTKAVDDLLEAIESSGVPEVFVESGMEFEFGNTSVCVLGPNKKEVDGINNDINNESIVLKISYGQTDFLLTGDMEEKESGEILEEWGKNVDCEVLKVAHHGSATGTTKAFLEASTPEIAVISCGKSNPYGHPADETIDLLNEFGAETLRTDLMGDIAIITDGQTIETYVEYVN